MSLQAGSCPAGRHWVSRRLAPEHRAGRGLRPTHATDQARTAYLRHLYGRDVRDPDLYDLVIDSTVVPIDVCVDTIAMVASAMWALTALDRRDP